MKGEPRALLGTRIVRGSVLGGLAALVLVRVWLQLTGSPTDGPTVFGEALYLAPLFLACGGCLVAFTRARGYERRFWALLAAAVGLSLAAELYYSYYLLAIDARGPTVPSAFELLHVGAVLALLAMIVSTANFGSEPAVSRFRFFAAAAAGAVAVYIVVFEFVVAPAVLLAGGFGIGAAAVGAAYPVLGLVIVLGTFGVVFGAKVTRWRTWQKYAGAGLTLSAIGLAAMPMWIFGLRDAGPSSLMALTELGLGLGPYLFFLASIYRITADLDSDALGSRPRLDNPPMWLHIVYPLVLVSAMALFGARARHYAGSARTAVILGADIILAALLLTRSWLSALELQRGRIASSTDSVTGLKDERVLKRDLEKGIAEATRWGGDVALIALDIDDLTRVNELFGHRSGDDVLRGVAGVLREQCGQRCDLYRAGSDEFVVIAPGESSESGARFADELARHVEHRVLVGDLPITVSAGVTASTSSRDAASMIREAFSALQTAKIQRRGSVVVYGPDVVRPQLPEERLDLARKEAYRATVRALAAAVDARDPASREHSRRVGSLARELAAELGASAEQASAIETAGLVHDIGKLALPDELLWKHGDLDENDKARLREHVEMGERILRSTELGFILPWVRAHHERWDGAGYPDGLAGEQIPLEARILAVCDAYDAMTSGISAPEALDTERALAEIEANAGTQFEPRLALAFVELRLRSSMRSAPPEVPDV